MTEEIKSLKAENEQLKVRLKRMRNDMEKLPMHKRPYAWKLYLIPMGMAIASIVISFIAMLSCQ